MKNISTKDLVEELVKREAVEEITVDPYDKFEIKVKDLPAEVSIKEGPACILVIWD